MAYIYSITNLENKKIYVGKTTQANPYDRWKQHLQLAKNKDNLSESNSAHSKSIIRAIRKYGSDNFKFRIIEECRDHIVDEREKYWIQKFDACGKNGYNIALGSEGINKPHQYWGNHPHSKAVSCFTLEGEWIKDYDTAGIAADCLGNKKAKTNINTCIKGITFQALGYRWAYKGETPKLVEKRINRRGKIYGIHLKTGRERTWKCAADFAQDVIGNRKANDGVVKSLNSPNKNKLQVHDWYLFRNEKDMNKKWTPATKNRGSNKHYKQMGIKSAEKSKKSIYGVHIRTGERIDFESLIEASYYIKGEGDKSAVGNICRNVKRIKNHELWCYAFEHRWYES